MQKQNMNLAVGIVILVAIAILIGGVRFLSETKFRESTYKISAVFNNVGTLTEGDPVKINGVKKGKVKQISLKGNSVLVVMAIDKKIKITKDSRVVIQNIGLMGERMIGILLGTGEPLAEGSVMVGDFDSGIAEAMGMLGEVLKQVQETVGELQKIVDRTIGDENFQVEFSVIVKRLSNTTNILDNMISQNKNNLQGAITDLSATAGDVKEFFDDNKDKLNNTVENIEVITNQSKDMLVKAEKITNDIKDILEKINSENSSVGRILADTAFVNNLKATMLNADSLITHIKTNGIKVGFW